MQKIKTKTCQNCKQEFRIEPEDFAFYEKIKVPPPRLCPNCRLQRRLAWRNERSLYKRKCDLCGKSIISMYSSDAPFPVYCSNCWWSDKWDPREFGVEYNLKRPFLEQFSELMKRVPHEALQHKQSVNSDYTNYTMNAKDAYLSYIIIESENVSFSRFLLQCTDCTGCSMSTKCNNCVRISRAGFCSECSDSMIIEYCHNVHFTYDSIHCSDCYGCANLRHKQYYIFNTPYSKEEYEKKVRELKSLPWEVQYEQVHQFLKTQPLRGYIHYFSNNVTGEEIYYSENCKQCYLANFVRDSAFVFNTSSLSRSNALTHDIYDCSIVADIAMSYEMVGGSKSYQCHFGIINDNCMAVEYSLFCYGSNDLFGCIGIRNKKYCILNKEYDQETFRRLRDEIMRGMDSYGELFPMSLSPFAYNETIAQESFPLTEDEALKKGYVWKDRETKKFKISIAGASLPDRIQDITGSILEETIGCAHGGACYEQCMGAFKVIAQELNLYRKLNVPLPKLCPNCRYYYMLGERNPLRLFDRHCGCAGLMSENKIYRNQATHFHDDQHCPNEFETSYAPDRPEIVYCEQCYQSEVI